MKPHARFIPMEEIKAAAASSETKHEDFNKSLKQQSQSLFCFPSIESLLSKDSYSPNYIQQNTAKLSPYDIKDNQIIFDNQTFPNNRNVHTAAVSSRSSKSPPPIHMKQLQETGIKISIDNFNPNKLTTFTEELTLAAISNLGLSPNDLFYHPFHSMEDKNKINNNIQSVKREREKIAKKSGKQLPPKLSRNFSTPVRKSVDFPETFVDEHNHVPKQFMVCGSLPQRRGERRDAMTAINTQRVHTAGIRRSIKAHKLVL